MAMFLYFLQLSVREENFDKNKLQKPKPIQKSTHRPVTEYRLSERDEKLTGCFISKH